MTKKKKSCKSFDLQDSLAEREVLSKHERCKAIFVLVDEYQRLSPIGVLFWATMF